MWAQYTTVQKIGFYSIGAMLLLITGFVGRQQLTTRPELVLSPAASLENDSPTASEVVIHVVGAVKSPGVVHLKEGARLEEAVAKAGGPTANADLEKVNLAAKVEDGIQLRIPRKGEKSPATITRSEPPKPRKPTSELAYRGGVPEIGPLSISPTQVPSSRPRSSSSAVQAGSTININTATAEQLDALPGVGPATAAKIIQYREEHGGFQSVEELMDVKGIGPKKLETMRPFVSL